MDAWDDAALLQRGAEPVGIIALICQQRLGSGEGVNHQRGTLVVAQLPLAESMIKGRHLPTQTA